MHIVLTGGGTAGHVVPNLAIADAIVDLNPKAKITYIGSYKGMEKQLVARMDIPFESVLVGKFRRYFSLQNFTDLFKIPMGVVQAFWKLGRLKPDVVFSKGGFVSFPVVAAAWLRRIPVIIHESDAMPGLATKLTASMAKKILLAYPSAESALSKHHKKLEICGNPIRYEITQGDIEIAKRLTGFSGDKAVLLVLGGSSGSAQLNQIIKEEKERLLEDFDIIHITGAMHSDPQSEKNYWSAGFIHDEMSHLYALADYAMSRAGANTLAELEALQIPSLLYPLKKEVSRGDQILNAEYMAGKYNFMHVANEEKSAHAQLILLPERKRKKAESHVSRHIAGILLDQNKS